MAKKRLPRGTVILYTLTYIQGSFTQDIYKDKYEVDNIFPPLKDVLV